MYPDQHIHTYFSGDSDADPRDHIEKAISLGMERICFTDHHDHDVVSEFDFELDIEHYMSEINKLKEEYADKIRICCGVELGLQLHLADYFRELVNKYDFDFIIGSVHFIDGLDPYYDEYFETHPNNAYERYFEILLEAAEKLDCFDSLGHLDYIVRYGNKRGLDYSYKAYQDYIDPILAALVRKNKALECNSGEFLRGLSEPNPCTDILRRYRELGGELVTLGSDAHSSDRLGAKFEKCGEILRSCGFDKLAVYSNRRPEFIPI